MRATSVEGSSGSSGWSVAARASALGTAAARETTDIGNEGRLSVPGMAEAWATAAGRSKDIGVMTAAERVAA